MGIPKAVARELLNLSQGILSNIEIGRLENAKSGIRRLAVVVATGTDRSDEIARWPVEED